MHANSASAWVEAIGALLTGIATVLAGIAALRGLDAWRRETVGRRKAELAEEVLAQFYRARDIITWARFPVAHAPNAPGDGALDGSDAPKDAREKRRMYAPVQRLAQESQIFSELQASRYRFMAYFGEQAAQPFDEIRSLQNEVVAAAGKLIRAQGGPDTRETRHNRGRWEKAIGWGADQEEDRIAHRLERAVRDIESVCRPLIDERAAAPPWRPSVPRWGRPSGGAAAAPRDAQAKAARPARLPPQRNLGPGSSAR
jgi:hypothetical protein